MTLDSEPPRRWSRRAPRPNAAEPRRRRGGLSDLRPVLVISPTWSPAYVRPWPLARHCGRDCRASPSSSTSRAARWGAALTAAEGRASVACAACFRDFVDIERPGPKLSAVHFEDGQPVESRDSCPSIDIPPVGGALDIPHWYMAVDECAQALHRSPPVPANGLPGAGQLEQRHPCFVPAFKQLSCTIPREVRRFSVHPDVEVRDLAVHDALMEARR